MLRVVRQKQRLTLVALCQRTGIEPGTISRIELGKIYPYPGWRRRLAEALGEPEDVLFEEVPEDEADALR